MVCLIFQQGNIYPSAAESEKRDERGSSEAPGGRSGSPELLHAAIDSIGETGKEGQDKSLLTLAIASGDISLVQYVATLDYYNAAQTEVRQSMWLTC